MCASRPCVLHFKFELASLVPMHNFCFIPVNMQDETDERLICARDGIEQYIMQRIAEFAFKSTVDAEGDELLSKRMKLLSFLKPEVSIYLRVFYCYFSTNFGFSCRCGNDFNSHTEPLSTINNNLFAILMI